MKIEIILINKEHEYFIENYPPQLANKFLPKWYKDMKISTHYKHWVSATEGHKDEYMTAKNCPAIQDLLIQGIVIPLWGNLWFHTNELENGIVEQHWDFSGRYANNKDINSIISKHKEIQYLNTGLKDTVSKELLKIQMPYKIIVPEGYSILYSDPFYHFRNDIRCLTGLVEADKWGFVTFPFEILKNSFEIKAGEPLIHALFIKREDKIELINRLGTDEEYKLNDNQNNKLFVSGTNYKNW